MRKLAFKLSLSIFLLFFSCFSYAQVAKYDKSKTEAILRGKNILEQKKLEFQSKVTALKLNGLKSNEIRFYDHQALTLSSRASGRYLVFENKIEKGLGDNEKLLTQLSKEIDDILVLPKPPVNVIEKKKIDKRLYNSGSVDTLKVENNVGNLEVNTWNKDEILISIESNAYGSNDEYTMDIIEQMGTIETKKNKKISLQTKLVDLKNTQRGSGVQTNYAIWISNKVVLEFKNKYGLIKIDNHSGPVTMAGNYLRISAGNLNNVNNKITINYSRAEFNSVSSKELAANYSNVKINTAGNVNGIFRYTPVLIGSIIGDTKLDLSLISDFTIQNIGRNVKDLSINSKYSTLVIGDQKRPSNFSFNISGTRLDFKSNKTRSRITGGGYKNGFEGNNTYIGKYGNSSSTQLIVKSTGSFISLK